MSACTLLSDLIAQGGKLASSTYQGTPDFDTLISAELIAMKGTIQSVTCLECENAHDAQIIYEAHSYGYFCPDLGFVSVDRAKVSAIQVNFSVIVDGLANAFGCKKRKSDPIKGATWRIGSVPFEGGEVVLYFHPALTTETDIANVMAALAHEPRSPYRLVLAAHGTPPLPDAKTARLDEMVEIEKETQKFSAMTDPRDNVSAPKKNPGGTPNQFAKTLVPLIETRRQEGTALKGLNAEAKAIRKNLATSQPGEKLPSTSTVKSYITKARGGQ